MIASIGLSGCVCLLAYFGNLFGLGFLPQSNPA